MTELDIRFDRLPAMRVAHVSVKSASPEGEATALYLQKLVRPQGVRVTRLARGLPLQERY